MARSVGLMTDHKFAEALADNIMESDPLESAAFRSHALAVRSLAACRFLLDDVNATMKRNAGESDGGWKRRADHFRNRVGMERRLLDSVVNGLRAQRGILPTAPNPRGRARVRLAAAHPEEFLLYVREEQAADRERAAERKRERKAARRAQVGQQ